MTDSLKTLIDSTIILEYNLPNTAINIDKTLFSHIDFGDHCYKIDTENNFNRIIYESILYYAYDEFQLTDGNHQKMFLKAFNTKFKYNYDANELAKKRLGVYGEALLYSILVHFYKANALISRGYFYDIQKKTEITGYDSFHLIEDDDSLELWFGETKFYESYTLAINKVFNNITKAISDNYLINTNFTTILQHKGNIIDKKSKIYQILDKWDKSIIDSLEKELTENNIKLVYPILITFNQFNTDYNETIKAVIQYINNNFKEVKFKNISINYSIFFILLPIHSVQSSKEAIIKWIDQKEPLTL